MLSAAYGGAGLILWVLAYRLEWADVVPATMWHAHEMVYGFGAAGLVGILAALVPRWSGALPVTDTRLSWLAAVWALGRIGMLFGHGLPAWLVAGMDLAFLPLCVAIIVRPYLASKPDLNVRLLLVLGVLWLGQILMDTEAFGFPYDVAERGSRIGLDGYLVLIAAIGGYAIPDAINGFFAARGAESRARSLVGLDTLSVGMIILYLAVDAILGRSLPTSVAAGVAAVANGWRLWLWHGYRVRSASLSMLQLAYLWMVAGLSLEAAAAFTPGVVDMAAIHVLAAGAIGTALLAVISRESAFHRTHQTEASAAILIAYALVSLAVAVRIAALFVPGGFANLVIVSGVIWAAGFLMVLGTYWPARSSATS